MKKTKFILSLCLCASMVASAAGYKDGIEYFKADQFDNAKDILLRNIGSITPAEKSISYYYLGAIDLRNGDKAAAKANFDNGMAADAKCAYNYVGLGELDLRNGNVKSAEDLFKKAQSFNKKNAEISVMIARAYYNADPVKYTKEIDKYLNKARKDSKLQEPSIYIFEGDMLMDQKQVGDAAGKYENAIYYDAGNSEGYVKYANAYFQVNPDYAVQKLEELKAKQPTSALAQRELAEKYYENNQWRKASDQYGEYIQNPNHFPEDKARYSVLLYYGENYEPSLAIAQELLANDPDNFLMNRMLMLNLAALDRNEEANAAAQKFFGLKGYFTGNDYVTYSSVLNKLGKPDEGIAVIEKGAEALADNASMLQTLSNTYYAAKRYLDAAKAYDRYLATKGEYVSGTDLFTGAGRYLSAAATADSTMNPMEIAQNGIAYVDKALENQPNNSSLLRRRAQLLLVGNGNEMNQAAADAYIKLIELLDLNPDGKNASSPNNDIDYYKNAYLMLGVYFDGINDKDNAVKYFSLYYELDPNNAAIAKYLGKDVATQE